MKTQTLIAIPPKLKENDLVAISRKEYEEFSDWRKFVKSFKIYIPTAAEKRMIKRAREDYKKGNYLTIGEFKHKLDIKS